MNKWMKYGMTGVVIAAGAMMNNESAGSKPTFEDASRAVSMDAVDLAGGSKLKDRGFMISENNELEQVYVLLKG